MTRMPVISRIPPAVAVPALVAAVALALTGQASSQAVDFIPPGHAAQTPIIAVASSSMELLEAHNTAESDSSEPLELLRTSFDVRENGGVDLLIRVDGECAAWVNAGPAEEEPTPEEPAPEQEEPPPEEPVPEAVKGAMIVAWVEIDGVPVAVAGQAPGELESTDDGTAVYCNSQESIDLASLESPEAIIPLFQGARTATGFTWAVPDVQPGSHELVVKTRLDLRVEGEESVDEGGEEATVADGLGVFGKRLLVVERTDISFDAPFDDEG